MRKLTLALLCCLPLCISGCSASNLLSSWNTDAPDGDSLRQYRQLEDRAAGLSSLEQWHRWE